MATYPFTALVEVPFWISRVDFDRRPVNKVIGKEAREIRKIARRLISRRAVSRPGEDPGKSSGALARSIKIFMNRAYSFAVIRPRKTVEMGTFHPYMLLRGTKSRLGRLAEGAGKGVSNRRARGGRVTALVERASSDNYRIAPRSDYMAKAASVRRNEARAAIVAAVKSSLVPRKYGN